MVPKSELENAFKRLHIQDQQIPDGALIETFQERCMQSSENDIGNLRDALKIIGESRHSTLIEYYLNTGETFGQLHEKKTNVELSEQDITLYSFLYS